ncbi:MAG: hypothetical protein P9M08_09025 [Candidatus Erginobacter occultus]|nr:hypothetical protein [Candidatus Erginobacter occultus]
MRRIGKMKRFQRCRAILTVAIALLLPAAAAAEVITVMTANLNSGVPPSSDWYREASLRIFKGLQPDIVLIQEFIVDSGTTRRAFVDQAFGEDYYFYCAPETGGDWAMPNGVISRWPITAQGYWNDPQVSNRNFAWAVIDLPGLVDLQLASVHLKAGDESGDLTTRRAEAELLKTYVQNNFDNGQYIIVGGDLNLQQESEPTLNYFKSYLNAVAQRPADRNGDRDTNSTTPRSKPYDWIMPNQLLDGYHATLYVGIPGQAYSEGIVFDDQVFVPLSAVPPIRSGDSRLSQCYHMAVMKAFDIPVTTPIPTPTPPPPGPPVCDSGDYDGDGTSDPAVFRPAAGLWAVRGVTRAYFGNSGDQPVSGDYTGDGTTGIAIFRSSSGLWAVRGATRFYYGTSSYLPVPGDYDGDGDCDAAVFRPESGLWGVRGLTRCYFGGTGDRPVSGDYTGDGAKDIGIFRPSRGLWALRGVSRVYFGNSSDWTVPGDYAGDGSARPAIFRPSSGLWAVRSLTRLYFGGSGCSPVPAAYSGSAADRFAVFRGAGGLWAVRGLTRMYFGGSGDIPITR